MHTTCKKILLSVVLAVYLLTSVVVYADTAPFSGSGTEAEPFLIQTAADLVKLGELTNAAAADTEYEDKYYKLTADIDMAGVTGFYGIAGSSCAFSGTIDGNEHIISNMIIDGSTGSTSGNIGLLCRADGAVIKNLGLADPTAKGDSVLAGFVGKGTAIFKNCFVRNMTYLKSDGTVQETGAYKAAFVGEISGNATVLENCYSTTSTIVLARRGSSTDATATSTNVYTKGGIHSWLNATNGMRIDGSDYDLDAFITASNGAFVADSGNINDGFPILAWEYVAGDDGGGGSTDDGGGGGSTDDGGDDGGDGGGGSTDDGGEDDSDDTGDLPTTNTVFESGKGNGTYENPYELSTAADLVKLADLTNAKADETEFEDKYYVIINDIDMSGVTDFYGIARKESETVNAETGATVYGFTSSYAGFSGTIDGKGHIISNMKVDTSRNTGSNPHAAFIVWAGGAAVKNLGFENSHLIVANTGARVSTIAARGRATIENCFVKNMVYEGTANKNSILGESADGSVIRNCYSTTKSIGVIGRATTAYPAVTVENVFVNSGNVTWSGMTYTNYVRTDSGGFDKEGFISLAQGAFAEDVYNVNDGYPRLKWETERVSSNGDAVISEFSATADGQFSFIIKNSYTEAKAYAVLVAFYGGENEFLGAKAYAGGSLEPGTEFEIKNESVSVLSPETARIFLWEALSGISLYDSIEVALVNE